MSDCRVGDVYFMVHYVDNGLLCPIVESYIFLGKDLIGDEAITQW